MAEATLIYSAFAGGFALAVSVFAFASKWRRRVHVVAPVPIQEAGPRVLLVDDDPTEGKALRMALEPLGVRVVQVESAEKAIRLLHDEGFPLVIVDMRLPGLSGEDLVPHLRPRILLMSAMHPDDLKAAAERTSVDYLAKDGNLRTLTATVARLLDRVPPSRQSWTG